MRLLPTERSVSGHRWGYETIRLALTALPRAPLTIRSFIGDIRGDQAIEDARYSAPVNGRSMVGRDGM